MPKTPRKNPTPRKLLRLPSGELQRKENACVEEMIECSVNDSLSTAVSEDSKTKHTAINVSHSESGKYAAALPQAEAVTQGRASADSCRRSARHINTASPESDDSSTDVKISPKLVRRGSKSSKSKRKKVSKRNMKVSKKGVAKGSLTVKSSAVNSEDEFRVTSVSNDCTNNSAVVADDICSKDKTGIMMSTSATSGLSDVVKPEESEETAAAGQLTSPDESETVYMPTPQKNQLRFLSEELFSLNQESAHITTHIHRCAGTTPRRGHASNSRQSLSTPRKFNVLNSDSRSNSHSPRSTPRKASSSPKTPWKVKLSFLTTPSKSLKKARKTPSSKKKFPHRPAVLSFPTPNKKQTKRKLYAESPEQDTRKPAKVSRCSDSPRAEASGVCGGILSNDDSNADPSDLTIVASPTASDKDVDITVEQTCEKIHLTATNVRSIIRQLITNEHVQEMVRNTILEEEGSVQSKLKQAIFEPKMTRSKLKEVMGSGQIPLPTHWAASPLRSSTKLEPNFLDLSFPDDEDDEEYHPSVDEEVERWSDDDNDSVLSSQASDLESPCPFVTPRSSRTRTTSETDSAGGTPATSATSSPAAVSVMGPPTVPPLRRRLISAATTDGTTASKTDNDGIIARRTRSKLSLNDTPLDEIEASFVAPDITPDLYDESTLFGDDDEWQTFLAKLMKTEDAEAGEEDDISDPEYNVMSEDVDDYDEEEIRNDKATRVSKKELNELLKEVFDGYESDTSETLATADAKVVPDDVVLPLTDDFHLPTTSKLSADLTPRKLRSADHDRGSDDDSDVNRAEAAFLLHQEVQDAENDEFHYPGHIPPLKMDASLMNVFVSELFKFKTEEQYVNVIETTPKPQQQVKIVDDSLPKLTSDELIQLQDQMRKHVQLLTQTVVQSYPMDELLMTSANLATSMLHELHQFGVSSFVPFEQSYFNAANLTGALAIVDAGISEDSDEMKKNLRQVVKRHTSQRSFEIQGLGYSQMNVLAQSPVFLYPQMLPECRFLIEDQLQRKVRVFFSDAEDNLLAMGVDQFGHLPKKFVFVREYLVPNKTSQQLSFRFKNLKSSRVKADNAVKYLSEHGHLPKFERFLAVEPSNKIVAPIYRSHDILPKWFSVFEELTTVICQRQLWKAQKNVSAVFSASYKRDLKPKVPFDPKTVDNRQRVKSLLSESANVTRAATASIIPASFLLPSTVTTTGFQDIGFAVNSVPSTDVTFQCSLSCDPCPPADVVASSNIAGTNVLILTADQVQQLGFDARTLPVVTTGNTCQQDTTLLHCDQSAMPDGGSVALISSAGSRDLPASDNTNHHSSTTAITTSQDLVGQAFASAVGISVDQLRSFADVEPDNNQWKLTPSTSSQVFSSTTSVSDGVCGITSNSITVQVLEQSVAVVASVANVNVSSTSSSLSLPLMTSVESKNIFTRSDIDMTALDIMELNSSLSPVLSQPFDPHINNDSTLATPKKMECNRDDETLMFNTAKIRGSDKTGVLASGTDSGFAAVTDCQYPVLCTHSEFVTTGVSSPLAGSMVPMVFTSAVSSGVVVSTGAGSNSFLFSNLLPVPSSGTSLISSITTHVYSNSSSIDVRPVSAISLVNSAPVSAAPQPVPLPLKQIPTHHMRSPHKHVPSNQRPILPRSGLSVSSSKPISEFLSKPKPRKSAAKDRAKALPAIAPKAVVAKSYLSPVKQAAANIRARAKRLQHSPSRGGWYTSPRLKTAESQSCSVKPASGLALSMPDVWTLMNDDDDDGAASGTEGEEHGTDVDSQLEDECEEDSSAPSAKQPPSLNEKQRNDTDATANRSKCKKQLSVASQESTDPAFFALQRSIMDTKFAEQFLERVYAALHAANDSCLYMEFVRLLNDFGEKQKTSDSVPQLYREVKKLLSSYPHLVSQFSSFLLPGQAVECDCLMDNLLYTKADKCISALQHHLERNPPRIRRRVMRAFTKWSEGTITDKQLKNVILPLLRHSPSLAEEFTEFFDDCPTSQWRDEDFELVTLPDSDSELESGEFAEFEKVVLDGRNDSDGFGTVQCPCQCHKIMSTSLSTNSRSVSLKHCQSCALKVIRGRFYMQLTDRVLLPATFSYAGGVQNSSSPHANGATQQTEAATETGSNDVTLPNATDEGQIDGVEITNACGIISSVETDKQASATDHGGLNPLNTAGGISVMTMSLVDFPTYIHSVVEVQPLPLTAVHVDGTLQHSADAANIVVTDSTVPSDGQSCNDVAVSTMPVSSIFTNCDDAALVQQPAEWTREHDSLILELCREHGPSFDTYSHISNVLKCHSANDVASRFAYLLSLFAMLEEEEPTASWRNGNV